MGNDNTDNVHRIDPRSKPEFKAEMVAVTIDQIKKGWTDRGIKRVLADVYKEGDTRPQEIIDEARAQCGILWRRDAGGNRLAATATRPAHDADRGGDAQR